MRQLNVSSDFAKLIVRYIWVLFHFDHTGMRVVSTEPADVQGFIVPQNESQNEKLMKHTKNSKHDENAPVANL